MIKINKIFIAFILLSGIAAYGQQKYLGNSGRISFFSDAPIEDIEAIHNEVSGVIDKVTGEVAVIVLMTGFQFEKKLMQEHFNENYVESEKYPKSTFNGIIVNNEEIDYSKTGIYAASVKGDLTIHGVRRNIESEGQVEVLIRGIIARTTFFLNPEDYAIKIPKIVRKNIAENLEITVEMKMDPI